MENENYAQIEKVILAQTTSGLPVAAKANNFVSVEKIRPQIKTNQYFSYSEDLDSAPWILEENCFYVGTKADKSKHYFYYSEKSITTFAHEGEMRSAIRKVSATKKIHCPWFCYLRTDGRKITERKYWPKHSEIDFESLAPGYYQTEWAEKILLFVDVEKNVKEVTYQEVLAEAGKYPYRAPIAASAPENDPLICRYCRAEVDDDYCYRCGN